MGHDLSQDAEIWTTLTSWTAHTYSIRGTHSATWIPLKW